MSLFDQGQRIPEWDDAKEVYEINSRFESSGTVNETSRKLATKGMQPQKIQSWRVHVGIPKYSDGFRPLTLARLVSWALVLFQTFSVARMIFLLQEHQGLPAQNNRGSQEYSRVITTTKTSAWCLMDNSQGIPQALLLLSRLVLTGACQNYCRCCCL